MNYETCNVPVAMTDAQAGIEAARCLMCDDPPCVQACPAEVPVKHFIRAIRFNSPRRAINLIRERNVLAGICGLACPVEKLCVGACSRTELNTPIDIGGLQHYAAVTALAAGRQPAQAPRVGKRVAIIGGGPSGLAAAAELAQRGHQPTIIERNQHPGGICTYGVPAHRMPQELVAGEVEYVRQLGVEIQTGRTFGKNDNLDDLFAAGFEAVYIAAGQQTPIAIDIPGADLPNVTTWKDLLDRSSAHSLGEGNPPSVPSRVIVIGGGSVAMDVTSIAYEYGAADVEIVCLESPVEMPADQAELMEVWNLGARFHTRSMPVEITSKDGRATGLRSARIRWKEPDRFVPSNAEMIPDTGYWLPADMIVFAIGARPTSDLATALPGVKTDNAGYIIADAQTGATSRGGVYAGGDAIAGGGATIVQSVAEGKRAGGAIADYLEGGAK